MPGHAALGKVQHTQAELTCALVYTAPGELWGASAPAVSFHGGGGRGFVLAPGTPWAGSGFLQCDLGTGGGFLWQCFHLGTVLSQCHSLSRCHPLVPCPPGLVLGKGRCCSSCLCIPSPAGRDAAEPGSILAAPCASTGTFPKHHIPFLGLSTLSIPTAIP